jgi:hypothetical protein
MRLAQAHAALASCRARKQPAHHADGIAKADFN